jgi:hypothetical protein
MIPRPASITRLVLHIALRSLFHRFFSLRPSPILNEHYGVVANTDYTSEWVHGVRISIGIATRWVTLPKLSPRVPSSCTQNAILSVLIKRDCKAISDTAKISSRVPSMCTQNAILSLLIIHIFSSREIYVAIDNPLLVPSVCGLTTSSYLWHYVSAADNVSHFQNLQHNGCWCCSHLSKFQDGIQVTRVFQYCGRRQG